MKKEHKSGAFQVKEAIDGYEVLRLVKGEWVHQFVCSDMPYIVTYLIREGYLNTTSHVGIWTKGVK